MFPPVTEEEKKEIEEYEKNIDADNSRRFFKGFIQNDEIKDLDFPTAKIRKSLQSLIKLGYASDSERDTDSSSETSNNSSPKEWSQVFADFERDTDSSSETSNKSSSKEWSQVFAEDGHVRFDQIFNLIDPCTELTVPQQHHYAQTLRFATLALSTYNQQNEGDEYELVIPVLSNIFIRRDILLVCHVNFFAKPKSSDSPPELFFAEVGACRGSFFEKVLKCCILTPRLCGSSSSVAMPCDRVQILHPEDVNCEQCKVSIRRQHKYDTGEAESDEDDF